MDQEKPKERPHITLPVRSNRTACYMQVLDAEDRLIAFIGATEKDVELCGYLVDLINGGQAPRSKE
jgi:hypothetical protein